MGKSTTVLGQGCQVEEFFLVCVCCVFIVVCETLLLRSTGSRAHGLQELWHMGSLVVACGLSCPVACGILVPWSGTEPTVPCIGSWLLNPWTTRQVPEERTPTQVRVSPVVLFWPSTDWMRPTHIKEDNLLFSTDLNVTLKSLLIQILITSKKLFVLYSLSQVRLFCNLMDYSLPGSSVHSISPARKKHLLENI